MSLSSAMLPSSSFQIPSPSKPPPLPCPPAMAFQIADAASEALLTVVDVAIDLADAPDADAPDDFGEVEDDPNFGASLSASSSESARER